MRVGVSVGFSVGVGAGDKVTDTGPELAETVRGTQYGIVLPHAVSHRDRAEDTKPGAAAQVYCTAAGPLLRPASLVPAAKFHGSWRNPNSGPPVLID